MTHQRWGLWRQCIILILTMVVEYAWTPSRCLQRYLVEKKEKRAERRKGEGREKGERREREGREKGERREREGREKGEGIEGITWVRWILGSMDAIAEHTNPPHYPTPPPFHAQSWWSPHAWYCIPSPSLWPLGKSKLHLLSPLLSPLCSTTALWRS